MRRLVLPLLGLLALSLSGAENPALIVPVGDPSAWIPMRGSSPATVKRIDDQDALHLRCDFVGGAIERASWDRTVKLNLASGRGIQFQVLCRDASPVSYFSIYFQSGGGWYHGSFFPESNTGWNTISLDKSEMTSEGTPVGWSQISTVRISAWRAQDRNTEFFVSGIRETGVLGVDASVAILKAESVKRTAPGEARSVDQFTESAARILRGLGIGCATLSDQDVKAGSLGNAKAVLLPYAPSLPDTAIDSLIQYVRNGGKVIAFYSFPEKLLPYLHVTAGRHIRAEYDGQFAAIRFRSGQLPGAPPEVAQASWNIRAYQPIAGASRVLAEWFDSKGKATGHPAIIGSSNCLVMTHVLLPDDPAGKQLMLMAMVGSLAPDVWRDAATSAIDRIGTVGSFHTYEEAVRQISIAGNKNPKVASALASAKAHRESAQTLAQTRNFADSIEQSAKAGQMVKQAFCLAQQPLEGEFRAFWCHSAFGVQGLEWEEAISRLAQNGFTAVLPNMLWGGAAFYPSKYLPVAPEIAKRGDQIAQCLAAARKHGIQVHVWKVNWNLGHAAPKEFVERMRREKRLQSDPSGKEEPWLCPSHPDNRKLEIDSLVEVARNYAIDGIHFDYIRYPDNDHCFCNGCRDRFSQSTGTTIRAWPKEVLPGGALREGWLEWRRGNITALVKSTSEQARAVKPGIKISAAVFPNWPSSRDNIGQDWKLWCERGYLDFVCPMDYTASSDNFNNMVTKQVAWAGRVPCYPGIGASASSSRFGADKVIDQINITRRHRTQGFVIFNYGAEECKELLPLLGLGITARNR